MKVIQRWRKFFKDTGNGEPRILLPLVLLLGLAFLLYARSFTGGWTYDDYPVIVENPDIRSLAAFFENFRPGRPLRELSYLLDHTFFGLNPAGYRLQNIFWHGLNAWLLWCLAIRLRSGLTVAWSAAILFISHPILVEVVANTSHRKDSLALAFALLSLLAYISFCTATQQRPLFLAGAVSAWLLALCAKENAIVLPSLWLAYEWAFLPPERKILLRYSRLLVSVGLAMLAAGTAWFAFFGGRQLFTEDIVGPLTRMNQTTDWTVAGYYQLVLKSWTFMAGKVLWPFNIGLEYAFSLPSGWFDLWVLGGMALASTLLILLLVLARRSPAGFLAAFWIAVFWLPTSNLWPLTYLAADRYLYTPLAGGCLLLALGSGSLIARGGKAIVFPLLFAVIGLYAWLDWRQIDTWRNEESLWINAYRVSPTSAFTLNNLGNLALIRGDRPAALRYYQESFRNYPYNPCSNYNLALLYQSAGDLPSARRHLENFLATADPREYAKERFAAEKALHAMVPPVP